MAIQNLGGCPNYTEGHNEPSTRLPNISENSRLVEFSLCSSRNAGARSAVPVAFTVPRCGLSESRGYAFSSCRRQSAGDRHACASLGFHRFTGSNAKRPLAAPRAEETPDGLVKGAPRAGGAPRAPCSRPGGGF